MNKIEMLKRRLAQNVEDGLQIRKDLAEKMLKSDAEALYAIRWLQGKSATLMVAEYSGDLLAVLEDTKDEAAQAKALDRFRQIIQGRQDSWAPENSSSPFSNATNQEQFAALRELAQLIRNFTF